MLQNNNSFFQSLPRFSSVKKCTYHAPFGCELKGRSLKKTGVNKSFRFGFQGQEGDDEIKGDGNSVNYEYRMHDPRLGRFFAVDPLASKYPHNSVYAFSENSTIAFIELEGLEKIPASLAKTIAKALDQVPFGYITTSVIVSKHWQTQATKNMREDGAYGLIASVKRSKVFPSGGIQLQTGSPSELINDILGSPGFYNIDCAVYCQLLLLSSYKEVLGDEKFNSHFESWNSEETGALRYDFFIMQHSSAGIQTTSFKEYDGSSNSQAKGRKRADRSKVGSRVSLVAEDPDTVMKNGMDAYLTENIVHTGGGKYSAQGIGSNLSMDEVLSGLEKITGSKYKINQVEQYKLGGKKTTKENKDVHRD
jgi:RHS repeat-associated protein